MRFVGCLITLVLLIAGLTAPLIAQSNKPPADAAKKKAVDAAATERLASERRAAISLLISLADDVRNFTDARVRARANARIADSLFPADPDAGRTLFRKAWEAAEVADRESDEKLQEEIRQQQARTGGGYAIDLPPNLRREVLQLVARRDRALGEEFLEKLKARNQEVAEAAARARRSTTGLSDALRQRLDLAQELLSNGEIERALQFAEPALGVINMSTVDFLTNLRDKNPAAADQRFAAMLAQAATSMQSDANTVSLLSSYIFTPHLYVMFSSGGVNTSQMASTFAPANVSPALRSAFLQTAAGILLRPQPPPEQDQSTSGIEGRYLVLKRLMPLFEQYASGGLADSVRGHLAALTATVNEGTRQRDDEWVRKGVTPEKPAADQEQAFLDRIERAKTSAERDELYLQLAFMAMGKGDLRARDFIAKIDDSEVRKPALAFIDASLATNAIQKKKTEPALELVRIGELTHLQKAWVLTQSAKLIAKTDREKALELLEEAAAEARRIQTSDAGRPRALVGVATVLLPLDSVRAWDAAFEAVKAANSAEGFTGEDGELTLKFQSKGGSSVYSNDVPDFDLGGIFASLGSEDFERAVQLARGFQGEAPRATATIAIARAVLEKKK
jgi:hypothetical protein